MKIWKRYMLVGGLFVLLVLVVLMAVLVAAGGKRDADIDAAITHLFYPSMAFLVVGTAGVALAIVLAAYLVLRSTRRNILGRHTVKVLKIMGHSCFASFLTIVLSLIYLQLALPPGYQGPWFLWFLMALLACVTAALAFYFIASLISDAVDYREENELTV